MFLPYRGTACPAGDPGLRAFPEIHTGRLALTSDEALERLLQGNNRFVAGGMIHPHQSRQMREKLAAFQQPMAAVLCCVDSRVAPEIVFDLGLGDLISVRTGGPSLTSEIIGCLEFAVVEFGVPLIFVLGHTDCPGIRATMESTLQSALETPLQTLATEWHMRTVIERIRPGLGQYVGAPPEMLDEAARHNVRWLVESLRESDPILHPRFAENQIDIRGGMLELASGEIEVLV
jgi:carbonic anhydrase